MFDRNSSKILKIQVKIVIFFTTSLEFAMQDTSFLPTHWYKGVQFGNFSDNFATFLKPRRGRGGYSYLPLASSYLVHHVIHVSKILYNIGEKSEIVYYFTRLMNTILKSLNDEKIEKKFFAQLSCNTIHELRTY